MEIPKFWTDFTELFNRSMNGEFTGEFYYPDLTVFSNIQQLLMMPDEVYNYIIPEGASPLASGKTGKFYLSHIDPNVGVKTMTSLKNSYTGLFSTIENYSYQSLKIRKGFQHQRVEDNYTTDVAQDHTYDHVYIDVPSAPFQNQTYIHHILDLILGHKNLGSLQYLYIRQLFAGTRDTGNDLEGVTVLGLSNEGTLHDFLIRSHGATDWNRLLSRVSRQLVHTLNYLKANRYWFNHNDLKPKNVFVNRVGTKTYFQIADYDKSSISYRGYRFRFGLKPKIGSSLLEGFDPSVISDSDYVIRDIPWSVADKMINVPYANVIMASPFFYLSYDYYTLFTGIFLHPAVLFNCFDEKGRPTIAATSIIMKELFPGGELTETIVELRSLVADLLGSGLSMKEVDSEIKKTMPDYSSISVIARFISGMKLKKCTCGLSNKLKLVSSRQLDAEYATLRKDTRKLKLATNKGLMGYGGEYHICTSACKGERCNTNNYTTTSLLGSKIHTTGHCRA